MVGIRKGADDPGAPKRRLIDAFVVCGLGVETAGLQPDGRFHTLVGAASQEPPLQASLVDCYPAENSPGCDLPKMLPSVVLPNGVNVYTSLDAPPRTYFVVLTDTRGSKLYVSVLSFRDSIHPDVAQSRGMKDRLYADKCLCLVSRFPFESQYCGILQELYRIYLARQFSGDGLWRPMWDIIKDIVHTSAPLNCETDLVVYVVDKMFHLALPPHVSSSTMPPHVSFHALVSSLAVGDIITLFTALLCGRRIVITTSNISLLAATAEALMALLYPLTWKAVYVPVLPVEALECLDAPVPFFYGVCTENLELHLEEMDDAFSLIVADLDKKTVEIRGFQQPVPSLPPRLHGKLERALCHLTGARLPKSGIENATGDLCEGLAGEPWDEGHDEKLQMAFLLCTAELLGGYRGHLGPLPGHIGMLSPRLEGVFQEDEFLEEKRGELGDQGLELLLEIMSTYGWLGFLVEQAASHEATFFDLIVDYVGTHLETVMCMPGWDVRLMELPVRIPVHLQADDREDLPLPRPRPGAQFAASFPESPMSVGQRERSGVPQKAEEAENEAKSAVRERTQEEFTVGLAALGGNQVARDAIDGVLGLLQEAEARGVGITHLIPCFKAALNAEVPGNPPAVLNTASCSAFREVLQEALAMAHREHAYAAAGQLFDLARGADGRAANEQCSTTRDLRGLSLFLEPDFWLAYYEGKTAGLEDDVNQKLSSLQEVMRVIAELGLGEAQMQSLMADLPLSMQVRIRDEFARFQVLSNPHAEKAARILATLGKRSSCLADPLTARSSGVQGWTRAVGKVKFMSRERA